MFDIGFTELLMVGLVALIVIGPERLPTAARTVGLLFGRVKRTLGSIREEVEREIGADDIRLQLRNEEILANERKLLEDTLKKASNAGEEVNKFLRETSSTLNRPVVAEPDQPAEKAASLPAPEIENKQAPQ